MSSSGKRKPKFRVGQRVVWRRSGKQVTIRMRANIEDEKFPVYWVNDGGGYIPENYLRPLTRKEAGQ